MGQSNLSTFDKERIVSNYLNEIYKKEDCIIKVEKNSYRKWDKILFSISDNLKIHIEEKSEERETENFPYELLQDIYNFSYMKNMKKSLGWICHCEADLLFYVFYNYNDNKVKKCYTMDWFKTKEYINNSIKKNQYKYDIKITNKNYGVTLIILIPWKELIENNVVKEGIYLDDINWHSIEENDFDHKCPVKKGKFGSSYEYFDECDNCYKNKECLKIRNGY